MALSYHGGPDEGIKFLPGRYSVEMATRPIRERPVSFDRIARAYRWMEYLTLGTLLQRTRVHFLPRTADRKRAVVLGDGDGRFLAELLRHNATVKVDAVDTSGAMLALLRQRTDPARVATHQISALDFLPHKPVDLIATHFFLDCLTQAEVNALVRQLAACLTPGGLWVVSDFRIPTGTARGPALFYVGMLYRVFGVLTGLQVRHLPDHAAAMSAAGLTRIGLRHRLFGLLTSELWCADTTQPKQSALQ